MRIDILSLFPESLESPFECSIVGRAVESKLVDVNLHNIRGYSTSNYKQTDDYPYGGGPGMVMMIEPIFKCIEVLKAQRDYDEIIYFTPDGNLLDQQTANRYSNSKNLMLLCGHYKGVDQRVRDHLITKEISIGDYVLSGGELAAAVFCDSIIRLIPNALGDLSSALTDSFQDDLLEPPIYTRPRSFNGWDIPNVLISGDHNKIDSWRDKMSILKTKTRRPKLL